MLSKLVRHRPLLGKRMYSFLLNKSANCRPFYSLYILKIPMQPERFTIVSFFQPGTVNENLVENWYQYYYVKSGASLSGWRLSGGTRVSVKRGMNDGWWEWWWRFNDDVMWDDAPSQKWEWLKMAGLACYTRLSVWKMHAADSTDKLMHIEKNDMRLAMRKMYCIAACSPGVDRR